jgi:hypothetical protein
MEIKLDFSGISAVGRCKSDKPREWPNVAKDARDRSAELAVKGARALEPLFEGEAEFSAEERQQREGRALACLLQIARLLESVGACTRP